MWDDFGHLMAGRDGNHHICHTRAFRGEKWLSVEMLSCGFSTVPVLDSRVWSRNGKCATLCERWLRFLKSFEDLSALMNSWLCYLAQRQPINAANLVSTVDADLKAHWQAWWVRAKIQTRLTGRRDERGKKITGVHQLLGLLDDSWRVCVQYLNLFNNSNSFIQSAAGTDTPHVNEIVSSNIQLLYAWRPGPTLNWFLTEREASLSTDTQPCFPHLPHPTQITPPSALPHHIVRLPLSSLAASPLSSSPPLLVRTARLPVAGAGCSALADPLICL